MSSNKTTQNIGFNVITPIIAHIVSHNTLYFHLCQVLMVSLESHFGYSECPTPSDELEEGEVLVKNLYLSVDPAQVPVFTALACYQHSFYCGMFLPLCDMAWLLRDVRSLFLRDNTQSRKVRY